MTPSIETLRRAWRLAESGVLFLVRDGEQPTIEYPPPGADTEDWKGLAQLPAATLRVFTTFEDAYRYREDLVSFTASGDVSYSNTEARFKIFRTNLKALWDGMFETQMHMNEFRADVVLEVALSEMKSAVESPTTIDILYAEGIVPN